MSFDTDVCFKSLCALFYKFMHQQNEDTAKALEREMDVLIAITSHGTAIQDFAPTKLLHAETLTVLVSILNEGSLKVPLYLKAMVLLFHLAKDEDTRESLHHTFKIVPTLASFLLHRCSSAYEQLSMQCLQLLQRITYSTKVSCPVTQLEQLVKSLIDKVLCPENELTLPCLGLLANLAKNSDRVQNYIKSLDSLRRLYRALFAFMSHANWTVIVFALTIITALALNDHVGEKVFNSKNIGQTFQLLFNIVVNENQLLTRRYAVDLFIDLLQEEKFRSYLASYHNFRDYAAQVFQQLDVEDMESSFKILELLHAMTKIPELRKPLCLAIGGMGSNEDEETQLPGDGSALLLEPLLHVASLHGGHLLNRVVKTALSILLDLLKELTSAQVESLSMFPLDTLTHALNDHLLLVEESAEVEVPLHIRAPVMAKALLMLLFLYRNDLTRHHLLNTVDINNILNLIRKLSLDYASELRREKHAETIQRSEVTSVFIFGGVFLKLMCEMTANGKNKWKSTMSSVDYSPFLANGLCSSDPHLVKESLNLISDLDAVEAACRESISQLLSLHNAHIGGFLKSCQEQRVVHEDQLPFLGYPGCQSFPPEPVSTSSRSKLDPAVSQLAKKIKNGLDLEDSTMSEIMEIYEHKLLCSESNETHLQDLLEAKTLALNQADRLLSQYRCRQARSDAECLKLRSIVNETERKLEKHVQEIAGQKEENKQKREKIAELQREVASLRLIEEQHQELRVLHQETSQRLNQQLIELEKEKQALTMKLHDKEQAFSELRKQISCKDNELKEKKEENESLQKTLDEERSRSAKAKAELCAKVSRMELLCQQRESELRENEKRILDLQGEVEKHAQIAAMIHNLSSGKIPLSKLDFGS